MSLKPPAKLQKLQAALRAKAKASPKQRFHALYDKVYRSDILAHAYACCKANGGAAGVDSQMFADIERYGLDRWLGELAEELRGKAYRPSPVRRVWIPKPDGKQRPLGIPTIKDRVAQTAAMLVLEPIFEADLQPEQYAYRAERSALDAVNHVRNLLNSGYTQVVDADLSGYFDSIPHAELMRCLARRIVDGAMLHLLKMWLETPVEEIDERGNKHRTTRNKDEGRGTPQGAPISPLLSNLYMRRFVLGWKTLGHEARLDARIVNYADDFVICCRGTADKALTVMQDMMTALKLTVNETKTHVREVPTETFDFLGYTFGLHWTHRTKRKLLRGCARGSARSRTENGVAWTRPRWLPNSTARCADGPATSASARSAIPTGRSTHTSGTGSASGGGPSTRPVSWGRAGTGVPGWSRPSGCFSFAGIPPACRMRKREPSPRAGCGRSARPVR